MRWLFLAVFLCGCSESVEVPASPGAVLPRDMDSRQWSEFLTQSGLQADRTIKSFTPSSWNGFSADPDGEISYMDFGAIVIMWRDDNLLGTSDDTLFTLQGVPESIRPNAPRFARAFVADNTTIVAGAVEIGAGGAITFYVENVSGARIVANAAGFTAAGSKGIPLGWLVVYSKR